MINQFIAEVKQRGIARTNSYIVSMSIPGNSSSGDNLVSLFCDSVNLPGINIATTPARIYGESREMPYEPMYDPIQLSFYVDNGLEIKSSFDRWMQSIIHPKTREVQYYRSYVRDVYISTISRDYMPKPPSPYMDLTVMEPTTVSYTVHLYDAYPKSVNAIQMDASSRDIMRLNVTLQYKYWRPETASRFAPNTIFQGSSSPIQDISGINTGQGYPIYISKPANIDGQTIF